MKKKIGEFIGNVKASSGQNLEQKKRKQKKWLQRHLLKKKMCMVGKDPSTCTPVLLLEKVTSWLGQKPAKKASLKARLLSVTCAIGISGWLLKKFGKRKRSSKPFGFRSRVAIQIGSTAG